jgi:DNA-binding MarR family transcriptional regulator
MRAGDPEQRRVHGTILSALTVPIVFAILARVQVSPAPKRSHVEDRLTGDLTILVMQLLKRSSPEFFAAVERQGLSFTQVRALGVLRASEQPITVKALSDRLGLSLPAVSRAVESLVRRGDVTREEDPDDRRCRRLAPTARGRRTWDGLMALRVAAVRRFVDELEPGEREALADALRPIVERSTP